MLRKLKGSATASSKYLVNAMWRCPCPALWHVSPVWRLSSPSRDCAAGNFGQVTYLFVPQFIIIFLSYLTEVVWRFTNICSVFVNPPVKKHYRDYILHHISQMQWMAKLDRCVLKTISHWVYIKQQLEKQMANNFYFQVSLPIFLVQNHL